MKSSTTLTDPVLRLTQYWLSAKLMHAHVHEMRDDYGGLEEIEEAGDWWVFQTYLEYWLSALYVTAEGFKELKLKNKTLEPLIDKHIDELRLYRNATFHFQKSPDKHLQFFDGTGNRMNWAEELHESFQNFFAQHTG